MMRFPAASIRGIIRESLSRDVMDLSFRDRLTKALEAYPNALHPEANLKAAAMSLGAFEAAGGQGNPGLVVAAAMEVLTTSCHVLDRLADQDREVTPADLQMGPALLFLIARMLEQGRASCGADAAGINWSLVYTSMITAFSGQQMDIDLQSEADPGLEAARLMTERKSGAIAEAMAVAGALAAKAKPEVREWVGLAARYMGTRSQLLDDATDASTKAPGTSDLRLRKKTVPIVYFLEQRGDRPEWEVLRNKYLTTSLSQDEQGLMRQAIEESGALQLTMTLAHWYKMKAQEILGRLDESGCNTTLLRQFMTDSACPLDERVAGSLAG